MIQKPQDNDQPWSISASIGDTLFSFLKIKSNDPVYNFKRFAFPTLIHTSWVLISVVALLGCALVIVVTTISAIRAGFAEYHAAKEEANAKREIFYSERYRRSEALIHASSVGTFLEGVPLDNTRLLDIKARIIANNELLDVLFWDKEVQSIMGTEDYDLGENLAQNVWLATINKQNRSFVKFVSPYTGQKQWISVVWKNIDNVPLPSDYTSKYVTAAIGFDIFCVMSLFLFLLLLRLACEANILFFRLVDETSAMHQTIKKLGLKGGESE